MSSIKILCIPVYIVANALIKVWNTGCILKNFIINGLIFAYHYLIHKFWKTGIVYDFKLNNMFFSLNNFQFKINNTN